MIKSARKHLAPGGKPTSAADFLPRKLTLPTLIRAARGCKGCSLYQHATQTVFGEGPARARLILVGETPGDQEDLQGKPFVGPAGRLLNEALVEAGLNRADVYVTNAVKHFKWEPRGKRRLHKKPTAREIAACRPWLDTELEVVKPSVIVCLGATAAQTILGRAFRVSRQRGQPVELANGTKAVATHHPSAVLREPERSARQRMRRELAADLSIAAGLLGQHD
ncbi:MAG TPA: UdgX family uracil-DNA binding protein [Planctomycetaceae bacterium]|jgi:uracil-DNA glycosylase family protein|nr:UdgX family uracil-DNA binding protein [Planctomycetaceae bacterium]